MRPGYVNLKIVPRQNIPEEALRTYHIGNTSVYLTGYNGEQPNDSLKLRNFTINYSGKKPGIRYGVLRKRFLYLKRRSIFADQTELYPGSIVHDWVCSNTMISIYSPYRKRYTGRTRNAMFDLPYDSELELNVTTKSTKQTGPGAIFNLSRKTSNAWEHHSIWS